LLPLRADCALPIRTARCRRHVIALADPSAGMCFTRRASRSGRFMEQARIEHTERVARTDRHRRARDIAFRKTAMPGSVSRVSPKKDKREAEGDTATLSLHSVPLPSNLYPFAEILGVQETFNLIEKARGAELWIPNGTTKRVKDLEKFKSTYGQPLADLLVRYFGGGSVDVPLARAWMARVYYERGLSQSEIAIKLGCTRRGVNRFLNPNQHKTRRKVITFYTHSGDDRLIAGPPRPPVGEEGRP